MTLTKTKYCFLDLETTGFDPKKDSIIEIAFIIYQDGAEISRYEKVITPDKSEMSDFVSQLTGITQAEIDTTGVYFKSIVTEVQALLLNTVIVGHNIDFDIGFLRENGITLDPLMRIDTHELARILLPNEPSYALEVLSQNYGLSHTSAHRAMSDVVASQAFYEILSAKIEDLPSDFIEDIRPVLETQTKWFARHLFLQSRSTGNFSPNYNKNKGGVGAEDVNSNSWADLETLNNAKTDQSIRFLNNEKGAEAIQFLAANNTQKSLIISPKLDYFGQNEMFPTQEVIIDPDRLEVWKNRQDTLPAEAITFYLKCRWRYFLGYRGLFHYDLFFKERDLWGEVCLASAQHPTFQDIIKEKSQNHTLAMSPAAFFRFIDLDIFKDRTLYFDETEEVARQLLHFPTIKTDFKDLLDHTTDSIATGTQFFIARLVKEFIEPKLQHQISQFPQKILLNPGDKLPSFAAQMGDIYNKDDLIFWQDWWQNPGPQAVRWLIYIPKSGNLMLQHWHPEDWRRLKTKLGDFKKVFFTRQPLDANATDFFNTFFGAAPDFHETNEVLYPNIKLEIPQPLIAQTSPDFNDFCADHVYRRLNASDQNIACNFSSLETLRQVHEQLGSQIDNNTQVVLGEKVSGGNGKVLEILQNKSNKQLCLCFQKMFHPKLSTFGFKTLVIQKFPFAAPDPLTEKLEMTLKEAGKNSWALWTIPQLTASLMRRIGTFAHLEEVVWLDPRQNSTWGKKLLSSIFDK